MATPIDSESKVVEITHPSLRILCETRQHELKDVLAGLDASGSAHTRHDIEAALDALEGLLTGNLDQIPPVVAIQLSKWIDSSKYLGAKETREAAVKRTPEPDAKAGGAPWQSP